MYPADNNEEDLSKAIISNDFTTVMTILSTLQNKDIWLTKHPLTKQFQGNKWRTPLMLASENNCLATVKTILTTGGDPKLQDDRGQTAVHLACLKGDADVIQALLESDFDVNAKYKLLDPLLFTAASNGILSVVKILIQKGANVNCTNRFNRSPLTAACIRGHISVAQYLISCDANIDHQDNDLETALHKVIKITEKSYKWQLVKLLLEGGSNVNIGNHRNHTPLYSACEYIYCPIDVIVLLLEYGADPLVRSYDDYLPLHRAVERGRTEIVRLLLNIGCDANAVECYRYSSPIISAVKCKHEDIVKLLIDHKADVNFFSRQETTALHEACKHGNVNIAIELLNRTTNLNTQDRFGNTPLYYACESGHVRLVQLLLKKTCDVNLLNKDGLSPLHVACQYARSKSVKLLIRSGAYINNFQENSVFKVSLQVKKASKTRRRRLFFIETIIPQLLLMANFDLSQDTSIQPIEKLLSTFDPQALEDSKDFIDMLVKLSHQPLSLKHLCCNTVRNVLGQNLQKNAKTLPIPKHLQGLIAFHHFTI